MWTLILFFHVLPGATQPPPESRMPGFSSEARCEEKAASLDAHYANMDPPGVSPVLMHFCEKANF